MSQETADVRTSSIRLPRMVVGCVARGTYNARKIQKETRNLKHCQEVFRHTSDSYNVGSTLKGAGGNREDFLLHPIYRRIRRPLQEERSADR